MIAKSDLLILTVSTIALAVGVYRWQSASSGAPAAQTPSVARVAPQRAPASDTGAEPAAALPADDAARAAGDVVVRRLGPRDTGASDARRDAGGRALGTSDPAPGTDDAADIARAAPGEALFGVYRVRSGDYLSGIAERFGTTVETLREVNDLDGTTIFPDQELRYPLPAN